MEAQLNRFLALDFETSGLDPKRNAPVTLGVALFEDGKGVANLDLLIGPPTKDGKILREYDVTALEICSMSWTKIKREGITPLAACAALMSFANEHKARELPIVAFNAAFDHSFYSELLFLGGGWNQSARRFEAFAPPLVGPWQCARLLAIHRLGMDKLPKWDLNTVAKHFSLSRVADSHSALEDAIIAGRIYHALTAEQVALAV
jgi:DNA polymerase III epsilon subunit-like protein